LLVSVYFHYVPVLSLYVTLWLLCQHISNKEQGWTKLFLSSSSKSKTCCCRCCCYCVLSSTVL